MFNSLGLQGPPHLSGFCHRMEAFPKTANIGWHCTGRGFLPKCHGQKTMFIPNGSAALQFLFRGRPQRHPSARSSQEVLIEASGSKSDVARDPHWEPVFEPTSPSSISMMLVASIWATSIERRICGKSTARSSPISSKTSKTKQDGFCHLHKVSQCPPMFVILLVTSTPNATVSCKSTANALTQPRCFPYPCCYVSIGVSPLLPSI